MRLPCSSDGTGNGFERQTTKSSMLIIIEIYLFILSLLGNYLLNYAKNRILEVAHHSSLILQLCIIMNVFC